MNTDWIDPPCLTEDWLDPERFEKAAEDFTRIVTRDKKTAKAMMNKLHDRLNDPDLNLLGRAKSEPLPNERMTPTALPQITLKACSGLLHLALLNHLIIQVNHSLI